MPIKFVIEKREGQKAYGTLSWNEKGLTSGAISGSSNNSLELPEGLYHIRSSGLLVKPGQAPFCDSLQNCWFQFLEPQFSSHRNNLGIHPDGNAIGTLGCIGLIDANTKPWYNAFKALPNNVITTVEVVDNSIQ